MKKKYFLAALLFFIQVSFAFSQNLRTKNWYCGVNVGLQINDSLLPTLLPNSQVTSFGGCASISDSSGLLLFYTNGETIWDHNHTIMVNGTGLAGSGNASQSSLIVPNPGNADEYFVFTIDDSCSNTLHYSIVDMSLAGGSGAVTQLNVPLDSNMIQKITGVINSTSDGYWIIVHQYLNNAFYAYPVTTAGIGTPVVSNSGAVATVANCTGTLKASPSADKLAMVFPGDHLVELHDFDNLTGILFNPKVIGTSLADPVYGCEFSPSGKYLYVNASTIGLTPPSIYQYDVTLSNAQAVDSSKIMVGFSQDPFDYTSMQLGLDKKIYCAGTNRQYISFILQPDNPGFSCNFVENPFYLGGAVTQFGLPNFLSNYFYVPTGINNVEIENNYVLYPNPATNYFIVESEKAKNFSVQISDLTGREIYYSAEGSFRRGRKFFLENVKSGIYFVKITSRKESVAKKIVVSGN